MVDFLENHFKNIVTFVDLKSVSDGICNNNTKLYINFDEFIKSLSKNGCLAGDTFSSPDTLLFKSSENHIIFVEFKDMSYFQTVEEIHNWWKNKNISVYLKISDSILGLSYYLKNDCDKNCDDFMNITKSFFYVYKADTYKKKIKSHLLSKFSRYGFLFKNIETMEVETFKRFLATHNL
mgnify:CR=1 FL=1